MSSGIYRSYTSSLTHSEVLAELQILRRRYREIAKSLKQRPSNSECYALYMERDDVAERVDGILDRLAEMETIGQ